VTDSHQHLDLPSAIREPRPAVAPDSLAAEIAVEQELVDKVYAELTKATERAALVEAEGLARGRTDRTGDIRDEEITGLFERDALVFNANKRRTILETQYEGLVFGRLDLGHVISGSRVSDGDDSAEGAQHGPSSGDADGVEHADGAEHIDSVEHAGRETRYVGRLGVRDDDYEPLVIDWRAPAAAAFYRSTPVEPMGVLRRRVLRCKGSDVVGIEDDLMVPEVPEDLVVVGDGALLAALTRTRGSRMRDIVATIQRHQDEAIRAPARRYEAGGILVVGPSAAYTAYIERVLPSLGEETVTLRSLGDVADGVTAERLDTPAAAALKGSLKIRRVLARAARDVIPDAPTQLRAFVGGRAIRLDSAELDKVRVRVLRTHQRNLAGQAATRALAEAAWDGNPGDDSSMFIGKFLDHMDVETFVSHWWRPLDAREVLLWLADPQRTRRYAAGILSEAEATLLGDSIQAAIDTGVWSVADVALIDDIASLLGPMRGPGADEHDADAFDELDDTRVHTTGHDFAGFDEAGFDVAGFDVAEDNDGSHDDLDRDPDDASSTTRSTAVRATTPTGYEVNPHTTLERLMNGRLEAPREYAHVLIDEAQDISPMQWRMLGRRGRWSSWTVVGDAAQASWPDAVEAGLAREQAFGSKERSLFHMDTNYRNAREIFAYASEVIRAEVPDADIPHAVRDTGVSPVVTPVSEAGIPAAVALAVEALLDEVEGSIAVIAPARWIASLRSVAGVSSGRVNVVGPMSTKGLEYDATVIVDPAEITAESPGGIRVLYVALTRAAHRMTILEVS